MKPTAGYTYFTDNGRCLCFEHLGTSARFTGRDISGQKIERISAVDLNQARGEDPTLPESIGHCETCGVGPVR